MIFFFLKIPSIYFVAVCFLHILSFPSNRSYSIIDIINNSCSFSFKLQTKQKIKVTKSKHGTSAQISFVTDLLQIPHFITIATVLLQTNSKIRYYDQHYPAQRQLQHNTLQDCTYCNYSTSLKIKEFKVHAQKRHLILYTNSEQVSLVQGV